MRFVQLLAIPLLACLALAQDYYKILGVGKGASDKEIKSAYRQLSKKFHPDKNPNDEEAHNKFIEIGEAYEVLSDPERRRVFDQFGAEGVRNGAGGQGGFGGAGGQPFHDPFDIFEQMFHGQEGGNPFGGRGGPGGKPRGPNMIARESLSLRDYYHGRDLQFTFSMNDFCDHCHGSGSQDGKVTKCPHCQGRGVTIQMIQMGFMTQQIQQVCGHCGGKGEVVKNACKTCHGHKVMKKNKDFKVSVPAGATRKYVTVQSGAAEKSPDQEPGDLIFEFSETAKDNMGYRRRGDDLYRTEVVSIGEALRGGWERELAFLDEDKTVVLKRGKGEQVHHGEVERIRGFGMPVAGKSGKFGDLLVEYVVLMPLQADKALHDEL